MSSIGILETLEFLDGKIDKRQLEEKIASNTINLQKDKILLTKDNLKK